MPFKQEDYDNYLKEHPYLATWCDTIEEADKGYEGIFIHTLWRHWNGILCGPPPTFVRYNNKTYTFKEFKKEICQQ